MAPRSRDSIMTYNTFFNQAKEYGGIRNGLHVRYILWRGNFMYWCVKSPLPGKGGVQFCRVSQTMRVITGVSSAATYRKNQCGNLSDPTEGFWLRKESERLQVRKKNYYVGLEVNGYIRYTLNHFIDELSIVICRDSNKHSCIGKVSVNVQLCMHSSQRVVWWWYHVHDGQHVVFNVLVLVVVHHWRVDDDQRLHIAFYAHWTLPSTTSYCRLVAFRRWIYISCIIDRYCN